MPLKIENNTQALRAMTLAFKMANKSTKRSRDRARQMRATAKRIIASVEGWWNFQVIAHGYASPKP